MTAPLEKPVFLMRCLIVSRFEPGVKPQAPDLCESSLSEAELSCSMAMEAQGRCPPEENEVWSTILSEGKEEIQGSWRGSKILTP